MAKSIDTILLDSIKEQCKPHHKKWFVDTCRKIGKSTDLAADLIEAINLTRSRVGKDPFVAPDAFPKIGGWTLPLDMWETAEAARILLVLKALKKQPVGEQIKILHQIYNRCEERVQAAIVSGLGLLDKTGDLQEIAQLALHSENKFVFTSLAWGNPYPASFFDEASFNFMIMKLLELGLDIAPTIGAVERRNEALKETTLKFIEEKRNEQAEFPQSVWLVFVGFNNDEDNNLLLDYLTDQDAKHRFYVASALHSLDTLPSLFVPTILKKADTDNEERVKFKMGEIKKKFDLKKA